MFGVFETDKESFTDVYFLSLRCAEDLYGTLLISACRSLTLSKSSSGPCPSCSYSAKGPYLHVAHEPTWFTEEDRAIEPHARDGFFYLGASFSQIDIHPVSNGSRCLVSKEAFNGGWTSDLNEGDDRKGFVVESRAELEEELDKILAQIGIPQADIPRIKEDILKKLN